MKILFLDDQKSRHRIFRRRFKHHDLFMAFTSDEAKELLRKHSPFDEVFLDHDLGGYYLPSDETSGYEVAKYITSMGKEAQPKHVTVHSWNEQGAIKMVQALSEAGIDVVYEPFC